MRNLCLFTLVLFAVINNIENRLVIRRNELGLPECIWIWYPRYPRFPPRRTTTVATPTQAATVTYNTPTTVSTTSAPEETPAPTEASEASPSEAPAEEVTPEAPGEDGAE
ncbi:uncharacterized protein LOC126750709 [Anthonomus grandis grandis]|uniref:uncharacterized protein LOC126750709 n=1 Tax=Anthonomus grandis grandis TaxID=2921223 RepID=UPI0021667BC8|nr:uncharacterized protein LOC126750709 [Anthonomus grandis grandis]